MGYTLSFELLFGKHRGARDVRVTLRTLPTLASAFAEYLSAMELNMYCSQILNMTAFSCIVISLGVGFHWEN